MTKQQILQKLLRMSQTVLILQKKLFKFYKLCTREKIYHTAKTVIGRDMARTQDDYGCAEAVNEVVRIATGAPIGGGLSTYKMYQVLLEDKRFYKVDSPLRGDIIISPTGHGGQGSGHVGIMTDNQGILSNNSKTAKWDNHLTVGKWDNLFKPRGFQVDYFRAL